MHHILDPIPATVGDTVEGGGSGPLFPKFVCLDSQSIDVRLLSIIPILCEKAVARPLSRFSAGE